MEVTIDQLERLFDNKLDPINSRLDAIEETLAAHTETLDLLVKQTKDWHVEMTVMRDRMERYESALKIVAGKLNVDIETFLH